MADTTATVSDHDKAVLRELAEGYAEIAALPVQEEKRELWRCLNDLHPVRPMVMVDQVCWNELNTDGSLTPRCRDPFLRSLESGLRRRLYQWEHFPVDALFDPWLEMPMAIHNTGFGIDTCEKTLAVDADNAVVSHEYRNLFTTDEDLSRIRMPRITHDARETQRRMDLAHEIFDGIVDVRAQGVHPYVSLWDPLSTWMSVESALLALVDRPDYIHRILERMTRGYLAMLDQLEDQGLLCAPQNVIHCTGAYTRELPAAGYDPGKPRCKDIWMFGLAQMLGAVSPAMYEEFEVQYTQRICARFGLVYYGCCDPLDKKMAQVRKLPHVRKVSMSPWADPANGAEEIGGDFVFSSKPNPANVAATTFDAGLVRRELSGVKGICEANGCPLELILKDISTVRHDPSRLDDWAAIAMDVVER